MEQNSLPVTPPLKPVKNPPELGYGQLNASSTQPVGSQLTFPLDPFTQKILRDFIKQNTPATTTSQVFPKINGGAVSIASNSAASAQQIAHGLGVVPNFISVSADAVTVNPGGGTIYLDNNGWADATHIYVFNSISSSVVSSIPCVWFAAYFPTS